MVRNSILRGQEFNLFWRGVPLVFLAGLAGAAVSQSPGSILAHGARAMRVANIQAWLPNQRKVFKMSTWINLNHLSEAQRDGGGTKKCFTSQFHFQLLEWNLEETKGQANPVPSRYLSPAFKESRIWVIQIHLFFPIHTSPIDFTRVSWKPSSWLSGRGHEPVKAS